MHDPTLRTPLSVLLSLFLLISCNTPEQPAATPASTTPWFIEVNQEVGLDFQHVRATASKFYFPEIMSGGVAWIDFDGDGWLDLYLVQGGDIDAGDANPYTNKLYRNINGQRFEEVSQSAGVADNGYGMGVAVGDIDNDGDADLYVTNVGPNNLYLNNGDGTFTDISESSGANHAGWGSSAAFADYDGDGLLDLFVVNYVRWTPAQEIACFSGGAGRDYCHPDNYRAPATDVLYHNLGNGNFAEVTATAGIGEVAANGLGIVPGDFNGDDRVDFYVANDGNPNHLWRNNGDGTFTDRGLMSGVSVNRQGTAEAGMGVVAFDLEDDGDLDLLVTHLRDETNTIYRNDNGIFQDVTLTAGLSSSSLPYTGFGIGIADFDHDGLQDLFVANGRVGRAGAAEAEDPFAEPDQVFRGQGNGRFEELPVNEAFAKGYSQTRILTGRGAALGDFDNDGDADIALVNNHGPALLLKNQAEKKGNWIGISGAPIGARLIISTSTKTYHRTVQPAGSYQSSNDPRVVLGLPGETQVLSMKVLLPDGETRTLEAPATGQYHRLDP